MKRRSVRDEIWITCERESNSILRRFCWKTQQNGLSKNGYGICRRKEKKIVWKEERFVTSHSIKWGEMGENRVNIRSNFKRVTLTLFRIIFSHSYTNEHHRRLLVALVTSCRFKSFDWLQFSSCFVYHEKWRQKWTFFLCVEIKDNWNLWTLAEKKALFCFYSSRIPPCAWG